MVTATNISERARHLQDLPERSWRPSPPPIRLEHSTAPERDMFECSQREIRKPYDGGSFTNPPHNAADIVVLCAYPTRSDVEARSAGRAYRDGCFVTAILNRRGRDFQGASARAASLHDRDALAAAA